MAQIPRSAAAWAIPRRSQTLLLTRPRATSLHHLPTSPLLLMAPFPLATPAQLFVLCRAHLSPTAPPPPPSSTLTISPPSPPTLNRMSTCLRLALTPTRPPTAVLTPIAPPRP